jgi:ribosomal protein L17
MRSTLSQAVASREHDLQPSSPETGQLMSALLMAAMGKLAAMRTTAPSVAEEAEDTVTRLMRGLFGNLLTIAGSGVRPLSMVWQLFGLNPQYDLPQSDVEWVWYETVVALYPYTGWPLKQFYENLEKLVDKAIVRVVTKNEDMAAVKSSRADEMVKFCKLRNIQLDHSRTIITVFMRMLTAEGTDIAAIAARLLEELPQKLEKQSQGYTRMIKYLEHLANGGQRRANDDLVAANIYTSRSAAFAELKSDVMEACNRNDWAKVKHFCEEIAYKHADIASLWKVKPESLKIQNMGVYNALLNADFGDDIDQDTKSRNLELTRQVLGDAETRRVPWQVGKKGQYGDTIEPLDEDFLHEVLTGEKPTSLTAVDSDEKSGPETAALIETKADEFSQFSSSLQASFINTMQNNLSAEDVCRIVKVPVSAMRVFIKALNPDFVWEDLGENFKATILGLLKERSNRAESRPTMKLLDLGRGERKLQIER